MKTAKQILSECFLGLIDFNETAALGAMEKYAKQQVRVYKKKKIKNASDFVQSIANQTEYIDSNQYKSKYKGLMIPVIEWNELIELAAKYDKK